MPSAKKNRNASSSKPDSFRSLLTSLSHTHTLNPFLFFLLQATNELARRLSFSLALSLAALFSSVGVFVDAPAAALVDLAQRRPALLRSLLIA